MIHTREEVIERAIREFEQLDRLVVGFTAEDWERPAPRPESKEPWTVKDALAHITYWKANLVRTLRHERRPPEEQGLQMHVLNHLIWEQWRNQSPDAVVAWHRQVQQDVLAALAAAPDAYFSGKEHGADWPADLDGHSAYHRVKDLEAALKHGPTN